MSTEHEGVDQDAIEGLEAVKELRRRDQLEGLKKTIRRMNIADDTEIDQFIRNAQDGGLSVKQASAMLGTLGTSPQKPLMPWGTGLEDLPESMGFAQRDLSNYSFTRLLAGLAKGKLDGLEKEMSDEAARQENRSLANNAAIIPQEVLHHGSRAQTMSENTAGGYLTTTQQGSIIDLLRAESLVTALGATQIGGLSGSSYQEPKITGGSTAYWLAEGEEVQTSDARFGAVQLTPRRVASDLEWTNHLQQTSTDAETRLRQLIAEELAQAVDKAALVGSGNGPEPMGILNTPGVGAVTSGGTLDWDNILDLEAMVDDKNARTGATAFLTNSRVKRKLRSTLEEPTNGDRYIWTQTDSMWGSIAGHRAGVSNNIPTDLGGTDSALIYGVWSELIIGTWGGLEVVVDSTSPEMRRRGKIGITSSMLTDIALRHVESFAVCSDITSA